MTLMETVLAVAVVGLAVPVMLAAMGASLAESRAAEEDTRAAMMARAVFDEVALLWSAGEGVFLTGGASWPEFGERTLLFDRKGGFVRELPEGSDGAEAVAEEGVRFVVRLRGDRQVGGEGVQARELSRVTVAVEAPAGAPAKARRRYRFVKLAARGGRGA